MSAQLHEAYSARQQTLPGDAPWLQALRQQAWDTFCQQGFPTRRDEAWKYVSLRALKEQMFTSKKSSSKPGLPKDLVPHVVLHNGEFCHELSSSDWQQQSWLSSTRSQLEGASPQAWLAQASWQKQAMLAMNTALMQDGYVLAFPEDIHVTEPVYLMHVHDHNHHDSHLRHRIHLKPKAKVTLVEYAIGDDDKNYLHNSMTQIVLAPYADLTHIKIINESTASHHLSHTVVEQSSHSRYQRFVLAMGSQMTRDALQVHLQGEHAQCQLQGLFLAGGNQQVANHITVRHEVAHCRSDQHYRGLAWQRGQGVFDGKIQVAPGAHNTEALQLNKNLLLSDEAAIFSKPQLEILNDDVVCRHGATVGQLERDALFYLQSRGMTVEQAQALLLHAFAESLWSNIKVKRAAQDVADLFSSRSQGAIAQLSKEFI